MIWWIGAACGLTIAVNFSLIFFWLRGRKPHRPEPTDWPRISILLAVRNEEEHLKACLESLTQLDYPNEHLEILIGNDQSTDGSQAIMDQWEKRFPKLIRSISIDGNLGNAIAKANVIAHLAHEASTDYFLITDADARVPRQWAKKLVAAYHPSAGIVTGFTTVKEREGLPGAFQNLDWVLALGMVKVATDLFFPVTTLGNNMLVSQEAYFKTGGYENLPSTITEDFALLMAVLKEGYHPVHLVHTEAKVETYPIATLSDLLHQRKRWMSGAVTLPWPIVTILSIQALFFPIILMGMISSPLIFLVVWTVKVFSQSLFIALVKKEIRETLVWKSFILYEFYSLGLSLLTILFYFVPVKKKWKQRSFT